MQSHTHTLSISLSLSLLTCVFFLFALLSGFVDISYFLLVSINSEKAHFVHAGQLGDHHDNDHNEVHAQRLASEIRRICSQEEQNHWDYREELACRCELHAVINLLPKGQAAIDTKGGGVR